MPFIDSDNPLGAEVLQEAAEAYFAACKKMVSSLEALGVFDRNAGVSALDAKQAGRRSQLIDDAAERVLYVLIQREAMKLSGSQTFLEEYGVPADVKARIGQPRREQ